jgi:NitT/TauT family transport system substrate-binding protein
MVGHINRRELLAGTIAAAAFGPAQVFAAGSKIVVQGGSPSANTGYVHLYAALQLGYFKQEGLDVEIRFSRGAPLAAQIVSSGGANFGNFTYEPLILGYAKGLRGKFVYGTYQKTIYFIGIPKDSAIKSVAGLKGKKLGVSSLSSAAIPVAKAILREAGVDSGSVQFVPVGFGGSVLQALKSRQIDAVAQWDAAYGALERLGGSFNYFRHSKLATIGNGGLLASEDMLTHNKDELVKFCRGVAKGMAFFFANPQAGLELFWKSNPGIRPSGSKEHAYEVAKTEMKYVIEDITPPKGADGRPIFGFASYENAQRYIDIFAQEMDIKSPPSAKDIVNIGFIKAFNDFDLKKVQEAARKWRA